MRQRFGVAACLLVGRLKAGRRKDPAWTNEVNAMGRNGISLRISILAVTLAFPLVGCHSSAQAALQEPGSANPADANLAQVPLQGNSQQNEAYTQAQSYQNGQPTAQTNQPVRAQSVQTAQNYPAQQPAYQDPNAQYQDQNTQGDPNGQYADDDTYYNQGADALDETVADAPPPELPTYDQPVAPGPDYIWTPGYWYYAPTGYYWVPGAWVYPPYMGALWTPGYWGWYGNRYRFHRGYWGPHVGFYGGINYGFGYIGFGYQGGYWNNNHFYYNRMVNRVPPHVTYVYQRNITVVNNTYINNTRVAYYGGRGGINRAPAPQERYAYREQHVRPMTQQVNLRQEAQQNRNNFFAANRGRPQEAAVSRPLQADHGFQRPAQNAVNPQWQQRQQQMQQQRSQQPQNQQRVTPVPLNTNPQINRGGFNNGFNQNGRIVPPGQQQQPQNMNRGGFDQQRQQQEQQRNQQMQQQNQQRMQDQQHAQQQRQQEQQQQLQQRQQQAQQAQQQRQQADQQRMQQMQQQRQADAQNQQRVQQEQQRQQQMMQQRQQAQQQQTQQRQAEQQQRMQQQQQQRQQQMQQRQQQQQQRQQAPRPQGGGEHGHGR